MKLLCDLKTPGAPGDYLYSRIRSRRFQLDLPEQGGPGRSADPRADLRSEYNWVYRQMNLKFRALLQPIFEYFELRTLVIALRCMAAGDSAALQVQCKHSLLQPQILKLLREAEHAGQVAAGLERLLADDYPYFEDLAAIYLRQGPGGLEQTLIGSSLQLGITRSRSRQVREFLRYQLDMRNLQALLKHLRWQVPLAPPLLSGGELSRTAYEKIWAERNMDALLELVRRRAGSMVLPDENGVEELLLHGLTLKLKRGGREPLQPGLVIDYLWRCQMEARNRGLELAEGQPLPSVEVA